MKTAGMETPSPSQVRVTVLVENCVNRAGLKAEHGLALWIETGKRRILFDTGQSDMLIDNARKLHRKISAVDTIVLSHGHYDHTGGLSAVIEQAQGDVQVYGHHNTLMPKYDSGGDFPRDIGLQPESREAIRNQRCRFVESGRPTEIAPGIWTTGEIPRPHGQETVEEPFYLDENATLKDIVRDDQALFILTEHGTVVLLGCAHAGLINTLDHVRHLTDDKPIHAVIGGMHLRSASDDRLAWTISALRVFGIGLLVPMHCTGQKAVLALWNAFPNDCKAGGVGMSFEL